MYRKLAIVLELVAIGLPLMVSGCHKETVPSSPPREAPASAPSGEAAVQQVSIDNFTFKPAELTVAAGSSVTWINHDDVPHTATSTAAPPAFNSGALDTDQKFSFTFKTPGTYPYFCSVHTHMTGKIIVK
jgi:plastocyanin